MNYVVNKDTFFKIGIGLAALVFLGGMVVPANAETVPQSVSHVVRDQPLAAQIQEFASGNPSTGRPWVPLSAVDREVLRTKYSALGIGAASGRTFSLAKSEAWRIDGDFSLLRIPVERGQGVTDETSISAIFSSDGTLVKRVEFEFTPSIVNSGRVQVWDDGHLAMDQLVTGDPGERSNERICKRATRGDWWENLNECLSRHGISGWVLNGAMIGYTIACAGTLGVGCVACISAVAGGHGAVIGSCFAYANLNT